ncbi:MAG: hypothetical protein Q8P88_02835 [Candidatus Jorgensenbacteria bacterium]|nr:hypothetical protein [Candidatus Jorgensenbacteria bacterium]
MQVKNVRNNRKGQALLLVVVMMGGIFFLVTAVAGLLMYYQVEQSNDVANSAVSIFAADAGLERALYYYFYEYAPSPECASGCTLTSPGDFAPPTFSNGASSEAKITIPDPALFGNPVVISANGTDVGRRTIRALEIKLLLNP